MDHQRNLLVIKASAGSGKTYRLAKEYIRHLLFTIGTDGKTLVPRRGSRGEALVNAHRQLLAITFTNKATDEMKQRIVDELYRLSRPDDESDYLDDFMRESGLDEDELRNMSRLALNELLFDYSNFNVSTIDSFFQTILRNFARELDRDFNYDIQLEEKYAVRVAVHNFLLSLGREGHLSQVDQWVKEYQNHLIHGDVKKKRWKFFDDGGELLDFAMQINNELFRSRMDDIRSYLGSVDQEGVYRSDFSKIRQFKHLMHDAVQQTEESIQDGLSQLRDALAPFDGVMKYSLKNWYAKGELVPLTDTLQDADEDKIRTQFTKGNVPDDVTVERIYGLVRRHFMIRTTADFLKHIENNLGLLGMLAMIDLFLEEYRHESNSILISDTNELIGAVLESGSEFVYERVGTTISHFMIDEFQDTSTKQYENFRGLLSESLSNGNFNMLIGDAKQSIYRFRNADLSVFREKVANDFRQDITGGEPLDSSQSGKLPTSTNYRSSRHIIEFNNGLFEFMRDAYQEFPTVVDTYADVEQAMPGDIDERKLPGYVRLITDNYRLLLNDEDIKAAMPDGFNTEEDNDVDVLTVLPGYLLKLHQRFDWGQIGILVNKNKEGNKVVDCILEYNKNTTGEKISIISGESLLLNNSPIIRRIIAMLRFIDISQYGVDEESETDETSGEDNPALKAFNEKRKSDQRLYTALNEFIKAVSHHPEATPLENGTLLAQSLTDIMTDEETADDRSQFEQMLTRLLPKDGELTTLVSIIETIIAQLKSDETGTSDVDSETVFLMALQDEVLRFSSMRNGGSVREFLKYWDEKKGSLAVSSAETNNAINIMSIHKAKGLEFDCVILPYANWEIDDNSREDSYWMPQEAFLDALASLPVGKQAVDAAIVPPMLHVNKKQVISLNGYGLLQGRAKAFVEKQQADVLIDNMNKTYVAMTRPCTELHIFAQGGDITVAPLLIEFATSQMTPVEGCAGWFEKGCMSTREEMLALREKNARCGQDLDQEPNHEQQYITGYTAGAIPKGLLVKVEHASGKQIKAGLRIHSLLSAVNDRDDIDRVIAQGVKHGVITTDPDDLCNLDNVKKHVRQPMMDQGNPVHAWFDPANKVYSERTITSASHSLWDDDGVENLRPDRIIRRPDGTLIVIDYKSGERRDKKYCAQVKRYIAKLHAIFPGTPITGRIWYITLNTILDESGKELNMNECD